jgi:hypothetical protein
MKILYLLLVLLLVANGAQAQREAYNWRFSTSAGLGFPASGPPVVTKSNLAEIGGEAGASISDAAGNLCCYSNGVQVWDRTDAPMPNGRLRPNNATVSAT